MIFKKMRSKGDKTKLLKFLKITFGGIFGIFAVCYACFLFVLPYAIDINKFTPQIEAELKKQTNLGFELVNPKIKTTWRLGIGFSADKIALKYKDERNFMDIVKPSIEINLPTLLLKKLNLDKIYAQDVNILLVFDKNKKYTIMDYFPIQTQNAQQQSAQPLPIEIKNINIVAQNANLTLEDKNLNKNFTLKMHDNQIHLASLEGPLKFKTMGKISSDSKDFVDFDINLFAKFPKTTATETQEPIEIVPFNPFENLDKFNFKSKIIADLKLHDIEKFNAKGFVKVLDTTLSLNGNQLPKSYLLADFDGNEIKLNTDLYIANNEFLNSKGTVKLAKTTQVDLNAKTEKLSLNNIVKLAGAILDIANIPNDFKNIKGQGYLTCDFNLKSDMKKILSSGNLKVINGGILYPAIHVNLTNIGALLDFTDNKISIKETSALLNNSKFMVQGEILSNAKLNIQINSDPLKIAEIMKLGESLRLINPKDFADYQFNGGLLKIAADIKGNLINPLPKADISIDNIKVKIKSMNLPISIAKISVNAIPDKKDIDLNILVNQVTGLMKNPKMALNIGQIKIKGNLKDLEIIPFNANLEGSNAIIEGKVKDYATKPKLDFKINGAVAPKTILTFVPFSSRSMVKYVGKMPFSTTLNGDLTDILISGHVISNPQNYVSVVDIENLRGATNKINFNMNLKGNNFIINDVSLNSKTAILKGKISNISTKNPLIETMHINIPQKLNITAPAFDNARLALSANLNVAGSVYSPYIIGDCSIANLKYPPFNLSAKNIDVDFKKSQIVATGTDLKVGKSDFAGNLAISPNFAKIITINNIKFSSNYFDSDELMKIMSSMPNTQTTAGPQMGIAIKSGKGNIAKLKSGEIIVENVGFNFNMKNNIFKIFNLIATAYEGTVTGNIDYNVAQLKGDVDVIGKGINVKKAVKPATGVALPLSGTLGGIVKVSFRGDTYQQQMRTLKGNARFSVENGEMRNFIRFENFLYASNILSQNLLGFNLNKVISAVTRVDTGEFKTLNGSITFNSGWANINEFKSTGPNMSLYAKGKFNLLTNFVDMRILGRISPRVVSILGPLGNFSVDSLVGKLPTKGQEIVNVIKAYAPKNPFYLQVRTSDIAKIPALSVIAQGQTKEFQVVLNGPAESTRTVKSFKWIDDKAIQTTPSSGYSTSTQSSSTTSNTSSSAPVTTKQAIQQLIPQKAQNLLKLPMQLQLNH